VLDEVDVATFMPEGGVVGAFTAVSTSVAAGFGGVPGHWTVGVTDAMVSTEAAEKQSTMRGNE